MKKMSLSFISMLVCLAVMAALALLVVINVKAYGSSYNERRLDEIRNTVLSCVSQCYALEGVYPPDLQYLEDNYGLIMDKSRYIYHYEMFASNIFPDVKVLYLRETGD